MVLKLRGLCDKSALDKYYHMENDEEGFVTYYGFTGTIIRYDRDKEVWNISVSHKPGVTGLSKAGFGTLVLGNHEWEMRNDKGCKAGVEKKIFTLSTCTAEQFTCNDGLCVDISDR